MSAEFERLTAEFERLRHKIKYIEDGLPNIRRIQSEISAIQVRATSADHSVTVVADAGGEVTDIKLTEDALKQRPQALAATLMTTLREAVADAARQQMTVFGEHLVTEDGTFEADSELPGGVDELDNPQLRDDSGPGSTGPRSTGPGPTGPGRPGSGDF